jgi:hypothetical protein
VLLSAVGEANGDGSCLSLSEYSSIKSVGSGRGDVFINILAVGWVQLSTILVEPHHLLYLARIDPVSDHRGHISLNKGLFSFEILERGDDVRFGNYHFHAPLYSDIL